MAKKRKNIFIHPDHIENLDETAKKLEAGRKEAEPTGYTSECLLRNTKRHRDMLLKKAFVQEKLKSGAVFFFKVVGKEHEMMMQPVPVEFMNRTSINHVEKRLFGSLRRYAYRTDMYSTPEPSTVLFNLGLSPVAKYYRFRLEEYKVRDAAFGDMMAYKLVPLSMG